MEVSPHIKIVGGPAVNDVKVFVIKDNEEIDISGCVRSVMWSADAASALAEVTLDVVPGDIELIGELKDIVCEEDE